MSEYYDALASAVGNLKPADQPARYAFYDRARKMVLQRLQAVDPPMADADIRNEMSAFNAAIRQLETDIIRPRRRQPPPPPPPPPPPVRTERTAAQRREPAPPPPAPAVAPPVTPAHAPEPQAGSLDIPPEFVGEPEPVVDHALHADTVTTSSARVLEDVAPTVSPATQSENSRRRMLAIVAAALVLGVLGAGAYAIWGTSKPTTRTTATAPGPSSQIPSASRAAAREPERPTADDSNMPYILRRQLVYYRTNHPPGTLVISKSQNFLYLVRPNSTAMRYTIGMGSDTSDASGLYQVSRKESTEDGLYLGDSKYRIRQSNAPITIGRVSPGSGFQLVSDDFGDLYNHAELGTRVVVAN